MSDSWKRDYLSLLDRTVLEDIRKLSAGGYANYLDKVIGLFEKSSPQLAQSIHDAVARNDAKALHLAAHSLKSSSMLLGATALAAFCRELETMGRNNAMQDASVQLSALDAEFEGVLRALQQEKSDHCLGDQP